MALLLYFAATVSTVYADGGTLKDKISSEIDKQQELQEISGQNNFETGENFRSALKKEIEKKRIVVYSKDTLIDTARAVSLKYLPFLVVALFVMLILGTTCESLKFLIKIAAAIAFFSTVGYLLIFFVTPIVNKILETVRSIKI
jgi:hypothetical protein